LDEGVSNHHRAGEVIKDLDVIRIPAGEFKMGCDGMNNGGYPCDSSELPLHDVYLDSYFIDKYEVSNEKYARCVNSGDCTRPEGYGSFTRGSYYDNSAFSSYPVINVDWDAADMYCRAVGKRLPTEAEWERAARGAIDTRPWPWGGFAPECGRMNFGWETAEGYVYCIGDTTPVGLYMPRGASPDGILNMAGNVWEWVHDACDGNYYQVSPYRNPQGPPGDLFRVVRGGSFTSGALISELGINERVCARGAKWARDPYWNVGIRCGDSAQ
jgi:formylglycine-generating enzyme required for sulfatase activity